MDTIYLTDAAKLVEQLSRFTSFVHYMDGQSGYISFRDSTSFLGREEDYKTYIAEEARRELKFADWTESWVGSGKIATSAMKAMAKAGNLVNKNQQIDFKNRLNPEHPNFRKDAERVLFDIYRNPLCSDSLAFENAVATLGAKYDTIAFLFFVKDDTRFLPISTGHFDAGFKILNIDYTTKFRCSWENYRGFINIIMEIRAIMEDMLPMHGIPRLIDAHSFLWIINGIKDSLGFGLGRLYSTTKVFLVDSEDKDNSTKLEKAGWNKDENDLLGFYTKKVTQNSNNEPETEPQVWLIMDAITAEAKRLCLDRKYIIAKVYIHEMMHRFFDLRPDLGWKRSVKEIEEPMAEFATLKFIEELSKQSATFEKLLPIALVMTEGLRKSMKHFIYALGVDLYYKAPIKLIYDYRRISMLLHKSGVDCEIDGKKLDLDPSPMEYVDEYVALCTTDQDLRKLVGPIKECIETYAKFFPLNKGIQ